MAQRKIIQITVAVTPGREYLGADDRKSFYALCDDSTLWSLVWEDPDDESLPAITRRKEMPNVPQPGIPSARRSGQSLCGCASSSSSLQ